MSIRRFLTAYAGAALAVLLCLLAPRSAASSDLVEESGFFRVVIAGNLTRLEGLTVKRRDAEGRLPIALFAHGKPAGRASMLDERTADFVGPARDLARRGWLSVVVLRRGFGQSDGPMPSPMSCASTSMVEHFNASADDLQATLDFIGQRPDADPERAIAIGVSAGGAAAAALSARNPKNLLGVVNISGGLRMLECPREDMLVAAFREFGAKSRVPSLWVYAQNDSYFPQAVVRQMHKGFLDGGGDVKLVMLDKIGDDGHAMFRSGRGRLEWLTEMDGFLRARNLPTWTRRHVDELMKTLNEKERLRSFIERYLAAPFEKVLVRSTTTDHRYMSYGFTSVESARANAIENCQKQKGVSQCVPMMENERVVGGGPLPVSRVAPPPG